MRNAHDDGEGELFIDGRSVRFLRGAADRWLVVIDDDDRVLGELALVADGSLFVAYRPDGTALTKPSRWGGAVTARFGSRELAARALLAS